MRTPEGFTFVAGGKQAPRAAQPPESEIESALPCGRRLGLIAAAGKGQKCGAKGGAPLCEPPTSGQYSLWYARPMAKARTRITLTAKEAGSQVGKNLIDRTLATCHDGEITIDEVENFHIYLRTADTSVPAVPFLRAITREIVADGAIDGAEAYRLKCAFERVVPKEVRGVVSTHLEAIGLPCTPGDEPAWMRHAATARQIEYIRDLGGLVTDGMTKGEASHLIEDLLERRPPTARQIMVIRFFDRMELTRSSKDEVSEWMDQLYFDEPRYELAWQRFKAETNHDRHCQDPSVVPIGAFRRYLHDGQIRGRPPAPQHRRGGLAGMWVWVSSLWGG